MEFFMKGMVIFMEAGISTACLYPENVEVALAELAKRDVKLVEIFINTHCEMEKSFVLGMKKIIDEYGIRVSSVHPFTCGVEPMMFFTQYERRFLDILEYYKRYFEVMNILGAKTFVFHGNKDQNVFPKEAYFERYAGLWGVGKEFGITVAQENVSRCTSGKLDFLKEMSDYLGSEVAFVLDTKQAYRSDEDSFEFLRELKKKIVHIHFSEYGNKGDCLPYREGEFNSDGFFIALKQLGFQGDIILELYKNGYRDYDALNESYKRMKTSIQNII